MRGPPPIPKVLNIPDRVHMANELLTGADDIRTLFAIGATLISLAVCKDETLLTMQDSIDFLRKIMVHSEDIIRVHWDTYRRAKI
jgi:hypothetical protein